jgi:hypothetical protein
LSKKIKIRINKREGKEFYVTTMGGQQIRMQTNGENDPRFQILGMYYIEGREMTMEIPDGAILK